MIVQAAHAIRRGETPELHGQRRDAPRPVPDRAGQPGAAKEEIVSLVCERLPSHYDIDPVTDIQVFAPVYRGEFGIDAHQRGAAEAAEPRWQAGQRRAAADRRQADDDRPQPARARADERNGAAPARRGRRGRPGAGDDEDDRRCCSSPTPRSFRLPPEESESLRLAYACSVHRGQGIELPVAVIVAHQAAGAFFLRREMLYTAITRARLATVIVGTRDVIARAARTPDTGRRHSGLAERMAELQEMPRHRRHEHDRDHLTRRIDRRPLRAGGGDRLRLAEHRRGRAARSAQWPRRLRREGVDDGDPAAVPVGEPARCAQLRDARPADWSSPRTRRGSTSTAPARRSTG